MSSFILNKIEELNLPHFCRTRKYITEQKIYLYPETQNLTEYNEAADDIFVPSDYSEVFSEEYFKTEIQNKNVYAPLHLYGGYLPVSRPAPFLVLDKDEALPSDDEWNRKKVEFTTETTLAELYRNAAAYSYDPDTDTYVRLTDEQTRQNELKLVMQKRIMEIAGDAYDRIADLSRMVLFLLAKVSLTDEEKAVIEPTLNYALSAEELAHVFNREAHIQKYVAEVKSDTEGYIDGTKACTLSLASVDSNSD